MNFAALPSRNLLRGFLIGLAVLLAVSAVASVAVAGVMAYYEVAYRDRMFPGVSIAGVPVGGLSVSAAEAKLQARIDAELASDIRFHVEGREITVPAQVVALDDPDASRDRIRYDIGPAIWQAYALGRGSTLIKNALTRWQTLLKPWDVALTVDVAEDTLLQALREQLRDTLRLPQDATLRISYATPAAPPDIQVEPEVIGRVADLEAAVATVSEQAERLDLKPISIRIIEVQPKIKSAQLQPLLGDVPAVLAHAPFQLTTGKERWTVTTSTLAGWLSATTTSDGRLALAIDNERLGTTLEPLIKPYVQAAEDGYLEIVDGRAVKFEAPVEGVLLDADATRQEIEAGWTNGSSSMAIIFRRVTPAIKGPDAERMGIKEIIGVGTSNFSGSPTNRRRNIALGAKRVHGSLIAPGEEFSLLKALGPITAAAGWYPELVIKGTQTVPELGGGLCQIGTTTFRAALSTGLDITERRNHSYRVRYYEPAGTDATIYDPAPDFKFKNDTATWVLFTTQIKGDELVFTVWGTKDGRKVEQSKPRIYNIVAPPPRKEIETLDLPPGTVKCTESAHAGASASFDYTVTYASGEISKETFNSYYRPWGAVCLKGVAQLSQPADTGVDETGVNNPN